MLILSDIYAVLSGTVVKLTCGNLNVLTLCI